MASTETSSTRLNISSIANGNMWVNGNANENEKASNNNGPTNGNTRLGDSHIPEEQTTLTDDKSQCLSLATDADFDDSDTECGLGACAPGWLQKFASKEAFLFVFCLSWLLLGMFHTYFVSVVTTIEKLFQIQSKFTGIIMSATEIGLIGSSLLLTYYGGQGHRPKYIASGMVLFAVSSFACSLPHFIYGRQLINTNDLSGIIKDPKDICRANLTSSYNNFISDPMSYENNVQLNSIQPEDLLSEPRIQPSVTKIALTIFFISLLGVGIGQTTVYTLGIPYIDDNVQSKQSPLYFAITIGVRILGPALGFIVGSLCTSVYVDLGVDPKIDASDRRFVGAWWLGLVLISVMLMITSIAMFAFPKRLPSAKSSARLHRNGRNPNIRDFPKTVKRLLKNDILMFRTASSVLHILPIAGLISFLPKYLESNFRLQTPTANLFSGVGGILVMGLGIILSGVFILRVKPNARFVAAYIAFTAIVYALGMGILMFIGCSMDDIEGHGKFEPVCNTTMCNCDSGKFSPVCGEDRKTYYSACHAGCKNFTEVDGNIVKYTECTCLSNYTVSVNSSTFDSEIIGGSATIGYCDVHCNNFILYIILFSVFVFIHSTSEVGSMLLILRCVDPKDKSMALGLIEFFIGVFGNVPCPILYGSIIDSACLNWQTNHDEKGACNFYDATRFRTYYHGTTGAILLCAFFVDVIVYYKVGSLNVVEEQAPLEEELTAITAKTRTENCE